MAMQRSCHWVSSRVPYLQVTSISVKLSLSCQVNVDVMVIQKFIQDQAQGILVVPFWKSQPWFTLVDTVTDTTSDRDQHHIRRIVSSFQTTTTPSDGETATHGSELQREALARQVITTMLHCRRLLLNKPYSVYIRRWRDNCYATGLNPISLAVHEVLDFLQSLINEPDINRGYSAIATAKSALSSFIIMPDGTRFGDNKHVKQFMKGLYNLKPTDQGYVEIWDPTTVLDRFKQAPWVPRDDLDLLALSKKLVFLISIVMEQRGQVIPAMSIDIMIRVLGSDRRPAITAGFLHLRSAIAECYDNLKAIKIKCDIRRWPIYLTLTVNRV